MMTVRTYVGPSLIEGVGIFAAERIRAGQVIWMLDHRLDIHLTEQDIAQMSDVQRDYVDRYGYRHMTSPGITVLEFDNGRFMNHSTDPNTAFTDPLQG